MYWSYYMPIWKIKIKMMIRFEQTKKKLKLNSSIQTELWFKGMAMFLHLNAFVKIFWNNCFRCYQMVRSEMYKIY